MNILSRLLLAFFFFEATPLYAQLGEWQHHEAGDLRLIASNKASADGSLLVAMQLKLNEGWHAYWRSPGDAGFPPSPEWKDSINLEKAELFFPWPHRYAMQGLETFGYTGDVGFPLKITKKDLAAALELKGTITLLVCSDICVPADYALNLNVPAGFVSGDGDEATGLLKTYLAKVPKQDDGTGLSLKSVQLTDKTLQIAYDAPAPLGEIEVVAEVGDGSTLPFADVKKDAASKIITIPLKENAPNDIAGKEMIFTLIDVTNNQAVEKKMKLEGVLLTSPSTQSTPSSPPNLLAMIVFALIGGLILNLMPCVFPVLALKSLSFIQHGGGTPSGVRLSFLATSAGILFSFLIMAGVIIALKHVGMSVGWGVQFQHPIFLVFLISILLLFSLNLFGLFEIPLPRFLADRLSWTQGHGSLTKDFFSGAFATLLATPCTAPFLGTAVGFALAGSWVDILAIFIALGIGLAAPFLLIALFPKVATWLPRPGAWMANVKKIMALLLMLTALWLGFVLVNQTTLMSKAETMEWQVFDEAKIPDLIANEKIVFVDVTADWCLTCQVNKKFVLERDDLKKIMSDTRIIKMKADWTKQDEHIGVYLKSFGRYGIPFNVIYSAAVPNGAPLPELLSKDAVLDGLKKGGFAE